MSEYRDNPHFQRLLDSIQKLVESPLGDLAMSTPIGEPPSLLAALSDENARPEAVQLLMDMARAYTKFRNSEEQGESKATRGSLLEKYGCLEPYIKRLERLMAGDWPFPAATLKANEMHGSTVMAVLKSCLEVVFESLQFVSVKGGERWLYLYVYALLRPLLKAAGGRVKLSAEQLTQPNEVETAVAAATAAEAAAEALEDERWMYGAPMADADAHLDKEDSSASIDAESACQEATGERYEIFSGAVGVQKTPVLVVL